MRDRYKGYDVLAKRDSPSWNEQTRRVVDARLALPDAPSFFTSEEFATVAAIAARLVPQPADGRTAIPVAALVDHKLATDRADGYRQRNMPRERDAWRRGLHALNAESQRAFGAAFAALAGDQQDELLRRMEQGALTDAAWDGMPSDTFFKQRMGRDVVMAYYAHPSAWSQIGFGGPASPRGYVRMDYDERDPWEAAEVKPGSEQPARPDDARGR